MGDFLPAANYLLCRGDKQMKRNYKGDLLNSETHKWCNKCSTLKPRDNKHFYSNKRKGDGLANYCKECDKASKRVKEIKILGAVLNTETEKWCNACSSLLPKDAKHFHRDRRSADGFAGTCKVCKNKRRKSLRNRKKMEDPDYLKKENANKRRKRQENIDAYRERERTREKQKRKDPAYRLRDNVSTVVNHYVREGGGSKGGRTFAHLPYTPQQLKEHLENQFEDWMTWENYGNGYGKWNIDHIIPQSKLIYDSLEHPNFAKCWSLENLRPMCSIANVKKSNRTD